MNKKNDLLSILDEALRLVSLPENYFLWTSWSDAKCAVEEIQKYREEIAEGEFRNLAEIQKLFAPTGPIQELSLASGWGETFLALAERFENAIEELG